MSGWSGWKGRGGEGEGHPRSAGTADRCFLAAALPTSPAQGPPAAPSLGGGRAVILPSLWLSKAPWPPSEAPTSKSMGGVQETLMVLVWPRSTEPLEGSMVKPLCCRDAMLSRLNSTVCRHWCCQQVGGHSSREAAGLGMREPSTCPLSPDQQAAHPTPIEGQGQEGPGLPRQWWMQRCQAGQGSAVVTFFGDGWVVRMQPTCSSRVAGGAGVSVSNWT